MSDLASITDRRREGGFNASELLKDDREWAVCFACRKKHPLRGNNADHDYQDFHCRHPTERGCLVLRVGPEAMEQSVRSAERNRRRNRRAVSNFTDNASVLEAFQASPTSMDLTSFNSLASSATAGWCSQYINNSSNLYLDYLAQFILANVNTAAAGLDAFYVYSAGSLTTTPPINTAGNSCQNSATTAAALTFNSIATTATGFATIKIIPYTTTNKMPSVGPFTCGQAYNGFLPQYLWWPFVNDAGPTIAASGNSFTTQGVYSTVA